MMIADVTNSIFKFSKIIEIPRAQKTPIGSAFMKKFQPKIASLCGARSILASLRTVWAVATRRSVTSAASATYSEPDEPRSNLNIEPPPLNWSAPTVMKRRTTDGQQTTEA